MLIIVARDTCCLMDGVCHPPTTCLVGFLLINSMIYGIVFVAVVELNRNMIQLFVFRLIWGRSGVSFLPFLISVSFVLSWLWCLAGLCYHLFIIPSQLFLHLTFDKNLCSGCGTSKNDLWDVRDASFFLMTSYMI